MDEQTTPTRRTGRTAALIAGGVLTGAVLAASGSAFAADTPTPAPSTSPSTVAPAPGALDDCPERDGTAGGTGTGTATAPSTTSGTSSQL